jgi:outer membrane protein insertion porin family
LGGDGITNNQGWQGREIYALRGYDVSDVNAQAAQGGSAIFNKYSLELRYPLSLNPSSTIFVTGFFDGGNSWNRFKEYDPFDLKRSAGMGLRVFLPMFGTLGFDYGFGFDKKLSTGSKFTDYAKFTIVLGFEPE